MKISANFLGNATEITLQNRTGKCHVVTFNRPGYSPLCSCHVATFEHNVLIVFPKIQHKKTSFSVEGLSIVANNESGEEQVITVNRPQLTPVFKFTIPTGKTTLLEFVIAQPEHPLEEKDNRPDSKH